MAGALRAACFWVPELSGKAQKTLPCVLSTEHGQGKEGCERACCAGSGRHEGCLVTLSINSEVFKGFGTHCNNVRELL